MIRLRAFVVFAFALFLGGCLCAEETGAPSAEVADEQTAKTKVTELQRLTKEVLEKAETKLKGAQSAKTAAGDQKRKAEMAESAVRTAAAEIKVANRKTQADAVVRTTAEEWVNCQTLYDAAIGKADQASETLNAFVTRARDLDNEAKTEIVPTSGPPDNYAQVIASAATAKTQTTTLSGEIDKSTDLSTAESAVSDLQASAQKVQVFKYQAESIAIVSRIETALMTAEIDIRSIKGKKEEINTIVQPMKSKCESAPNTSKGSLTSLCTTAERQLQTATMKLQEAQQCSKDMKGRKTQLDATLETLMATTLKDKATEEAANVKGHEGFIDGELQKIKAALGEVQNALRSAKDAQQQMQDEMSKHNSQSSTKLNEGNPQDNARTAEVTSPIQNGEAKNPEITETDQTVLEKSKDTIDKTSEQPVDANLGKTEQNKSTQLAHNEKQNPKHDKSELLSNDKLRNITKDITNNPLIGGEVPTRSAANDSAVTVFIPLLVILVISAVLHLALLIM